MTETIQRTRAALVLSLGLSVTAQAGYYYEATTRVSGEGVSENTTQVMVWVEGDRTRIEFAEGSDIGLGNDGAYLISTDAGETLYLVDPEEQTYMDLDLGAAMGAASQVLDAMGGMFKMEFTDFHSEKISEAEGGNLLGYETRKLQFQSGYTMNMSMMGRKSRNVVEMDQLVWVTDAIDARAFNAWLRPDKRMEGMFEGLDELMEQSFSQVEGVPLRSEVETTTTDDDGGTQVTQQVTEVTVLREESVSESRFEIPEGYTLQSLEPAEGNDEAEAEDNPLNQLKNIFGRRGGD